MLLLDSRHAPGALADATALRARLVDQEKHIVGISRDLRATEASSTPPGSRFPNAAFGYHLYADAEGAAEALRADVDEMRLRLSEEVAVGQAHELRLVEAQTDQRGDGPLRRTFHGGFTATAAGDLTEDVPVDLLSIRWQRGNVELYVDMLVKSGGDAAALAQPIADQLDATYTSRPLPAR